jgi:multisubunit Na+/H+ antiporter MnhB subunit
MKGRTVKALTIVVFFALILSTMTYVRQFGQPEDARMDDYFIENGEAQTGSNNIVAAVLFDYRGLDTLGEATVLFATAMTVFLVFRREPDEKKG